MYTVRARMKDAKYRWVVICVYVGGDASVQVCKCAGVQVCRCRCVGAHGSADDESTDNANEKNG